MLVIFMTALLNVQAEVFTQFTMLNKEVSLVEKARSLVVRDLQLETKRFRFNSGH